MLVGSVQEEGSSRLFASALHGPYAASLPQARSFTYVLRAWRAFRIALHLLNNTARYIQLLLTTTVLGIPRLALPPASAYCNKHESGLLRFNISNRRVPADLQGYRERDRTARDRLTRHSDNDDRNADSSEDYGNRGGREVGRRDRDSMVAEEENKPDFDEYQPRYDDDNAIPIGQDAVESIVLDYLS